MQGWVIDRDYQSDGEDELNRVGYGQKLAEADDTAGQLLLRQIHVLTGMSASDVEDPVRWRLLDEDGVVYYGGACTLDWIMGEDDYAYNILKFGEADAGATDLQFRASDLPTKVVERHREINCVVKSGDTEWVVLHG